MEQQPLFAGRTQQSNVLVYASVAAGAIYTMATILVAIARGFAQSHVHTLLSLGLVAVAGCEGQLLRWYRQGDLEPHFKGLVICLGLALVLLCTVANVYLWTAKSCSMEFPWE